MQRGKCQLPWKLNYVELLFKLCFIKPLTLILVSFCEMILLLLVWSFGLRNIQGGFILYINRLVASLVAMTKNFSCYLRKEGFDLSVEGTVVHIMVEESWRKAGTRGDWSQLCLCCQQTGRMFSPICIFSFFIQSKMSTFRVGLPSSFKYFYELSHRHTHWYIS